MARLFLDMKSPLAGVKGGVAVRNGRARLGGWDMKAAKAGGLQRLWSQSRWLRPVKAPITCHCIIIGLALIDLDDSTVPALGATLLAFPSMTLV